MCERALRASDFTIFSKDNTAHMSHLEAYSEVNGRVEFRADSLRQIVAEGRRILLYVLVYVCPHLQGACAGSTVNLLRRY